MPYSTAAKNLMLDALAAVAAKASLHSADPGANGANELQGGEPAYARKDINWNPAAAGNLDSSDQPVFDVPAGTVAHVGFWTAGGVFLGSGQVTAEEFAGQGTYTLTDADLDLNG